jgi:hypothetical protein
MGREIRGGARVSNSARRGGACAGPSAGGAHASRGVQLAGALRMAWRVAHLLQEDLEGKLGIVCHARLPARHQGKRVPAALAAAGVACVVAAPPTAAAAAPTPSAAQVAADATAA